MIRLWLLFSIAIVYAASGYAGQLNLTQKQLKQLNYKIKQLSQRLENSHDKKDTLQQELRRLDKRIAKVSRNQLQLTHKINHKQAQAKKIEQKSKQLKQQLANEQKKLAQLMRNQYNMGDNPWLKLLLNQQNPQQKQRLLDYFSYIYQSRQQTLSKVNKLKQQSEQQQKALDEEIHQLNQLQQRYKQQQQALLADSHYQQAVIVKLDKQIESNNQRLATYRSDKKRLEQLLNQLKTNQSYRQNTPFWQMRRKLPWPVKGVLSNTDNKHGISLKAPQGQKIAAIYPGKVVFSDWLKGYGLLIILDHGHGYMSLYAHNQSLYKLIGDRVEQGETIATIGHSGGAKQNSLYFEIRHNGKPVSPLKWLA